MLEERRDIALAKRNLFLRLLYHFLNQSHIITRTQRQSLPVFKRAFRAHTNNIFEGEEK
jgi:hypothetical protein